MSREYRFFVYIMASKSRRIYTGVTNNIERRAAQHKSGEIKGFTQRYRINRLVYYEVFQYVENAIRREKEIKGWDRAKRVALIEGENPTWDDLAEDWGKAIELLKPVLVPARADPSPAKAGS
jgi:putative endonuclease